MKRLLITTLALVVAGLLAMPGVASAQDDVDVQGRGWLYAIGDGQVSLDMGGRLRLHVNGDVTVTDNAGDMRIRIRGGSGPDEERTANLTLDDFAGTVRVWGTDFTVTVDGKVVLDAHGHGRAELEGQGRYRTRHRGWTPWDGSTLQLEDDAAGTAA